MKCTSINTSKMKFRPGERIIDPKFFKDMKFSFRQSRLSFVRARYTEFLQTHHPPLKFDLSLEQLPIIDLPPLPPAQASTASSNDGWQNHPVHFQAQGLEDKNVLILALYPPSESVPTAEHENRTSNDIQKIMQGFRFVWEDLFPFMTTWTKNFC
jgi:hypothetical protein